MSRKIKGQTTRTRTVLHKLKKKYRITRAGERTYRIEINCIKLMQNMFNNREVNLDKIKYWWTRHGKTITIHFVR